MSAPTCARCGRVMTPRKNWDRQREPVKYCSKQCRTRRIRPVDRMLEAAIVALLSERSAAASICPSEAARRVKPEGWEMLMEPCRMAARRLVAKGCAEITQNKRVVDPSTAKGPIRVRRGPQFRPASDGG